jgi:glyoxylase-like metal-dependent hydrolase (beta-lactamase superfamily II)/rhodanese-related sulfurtransferase
MTGPSIIEFVDEGLGHSSYLVDLGDGTALVIDPARLPTAQLAEAQRQGLSVAFTADTHTHADYVSGSPDLASRGATFIAPTEAKLQTPHRGVMGGDEVAVGRYRLRAIATPGHTPDHLAYLLLTDGVPVALFSGGSLMVGTAGRTDLLGDDHADELAHRLYHSLHDELLALPDDLRVYPTHGAGSFCAAPAGSARTTTIGRERATNPLLGLDEEAFVHHLVAGFGTLPAHFRRLPELNRRGPRIYPAVPPLDRLDPSAVQSLMERGATLVDVRPIAAYAQAHPAGAVSIELRPVFASWAGWLLDPATPVVFIIDDDQDQTDLVHQCLTVGIENLAGRLDGGPTAWRAAGIGIESTPLVAPDAMAATVIDVRQHDEFASAHVPGSVNVELGDVGAAELPDGPVTVMCGHGERAMTGASILAALGEGDITVLAGGPDTWTEATGRPLSRS